MENLLRTCSKGSIEGGCVGYLEATHTHTHTHIPRGLLATPPSIVLPAHVPTCQKTGVCVCLDVCVCVCVREESNENSQPLSN